MKENVAYFILHNSTIMALIPELFVILQPILAVLMTGNIYKSSFGRMHMLGFENSLKHRLYSLPLLEASLLDKNSPFHKLFPKKNSVVHPRLKESVWLLLSSYAVLLVDVVLLILNYAFINNIAFLKVLLIVNFSFAIIVVLYFSIIITIIDTRINNYRLMKVSNKKTSELLKSITDDYPNFFDFKLDLQELKTLKDDFRFYYKMNDKEIFSHSTTVDYDKILYKEFLSFVKSDLFKSLLKNKQTWVEVDWRKKERNGSMVFYINVEIEINPLMTTKFFTSEILVVDKKNHQTFNKWNNEKFITNLKEYIK